MNQSLKIVNMFSRIIDLLVLNILFVLTSIPIITMGASLTALYAVTLKMVRNEESYIARSYFRAFKRNFALATKTFVPAAAFSALMIANIILSFSQTGTYFLIIQIASTVFLCLITIYSIYFFPVLARFEFTFKQIIAHISHMILTHISLFLFIICLNIPVIFLAIYSVNTAIFLLILFLIIGTSLMAYMQSFIFRRIFENYEK